MILDIRGCYVKKPLWQRVVIGFLIQIIRSIFTPKTMIFRHYIVIQKSFTNFYTEKSD